MKTFKRILSIVLLASMMLAMFVSCKKDEVKEPEIPAGIDISSYRRIVRPDASSPDLARFVTLFKRELLRYTKADLPVATDYDPAEEGTKEILIGETNRPESIAAMATLENAPKNAFTIQASENNIVIAAKNDDALIRALKYFYMTYASKCETENYISLEVGSIDNGTVDLDSLIFDNFAEFSVQLSTPIAYSGRDFSGLCAYETLIELCHNGDNNGTLFASFATYEKNGYMIYKSTNGGKSWEHISTAIDTYNTSKSNPKNPTTHLVDNYCLQPCLYELPCDMGDFKEGTLFLGACSKGTGYYKGEETSTSSMTLYYSTDLGVTWKAYCNVDLAGNADDQNGVWEPYFIFEEETGRVYCYYSDESDEANDKNGVHAQKLVFKYTTDMKTWVGKDGKTGVTDDPFIAVHCDGENLRPGMISIAKMGNGEYFMPYEVCGMSGCPIYYRKTTNLAEWPDTGSVGTQIKSKDGLTLGGAPWCAWTPAGGECGTLIVIGDFKTLFLSFDYGETFVSIKNPMYEGQKNISGSKNSYSPFLGFFSDETILYYVDNPFDVKTDSYQRILFQKIKIW